jgi:hypothetical protein
MSDFRLGTVPSSSILYVYSMRDTIWPAPAYQRTSDVWPPEKRQLLIDSIINGYDVPKLYFHEFFPSKDVDGKRYKYAIVDGKQRIQSIFEFIEGKFALPQDTEYIHDPSVKIGGLRYKELAREYPDLKNRFDGFVLPIVTIQTQDVELIEDMFSRLNEAVPLNAAEKRNAFGGPIPPIVRDHASLTFFKKKLPFNNARYRHFDLVTKFLYVQHRNALVDTKKAYLDEFVRSFRSDKKEEAASLEKEAALLGQKSKVVVDAMSKVFMDGDPLLRSVGMVLLYYWLFREALNDGWANKLARSALLDFEEQRRVNRVQAEKDVTEAKYHLLEFDRLTQSPNDSVALRYRYAVLRHYIGPAKGRPPIPGEE